MVSRLVKTEFDRKLAIRLLQERKLPFAVEISKKRTLPQNNLGHKWYAEIAEQMGDTTAEEIRGYCKLHLGVPILREENEEFRTRYDLVIKPLPYEIKLLAMQEPIAWPVTSLMKTKQKSLYLETMLHHFVERGIVLTVPDDRAPPIGEAA